MGEQRRGLKVENTQKGPRWMGNKVAILIWGERTATFLEQGVKVEAGTPGAGDGRFLWKLRREEQ